MRISSEITLAKELQDGAAGEIELERDQGHALRTGPQEKTTSSLLRGMDIVEGSDRTVAEQLRDALSRNAVRVIDLFREWDDDGTGTVDKKEFRRGMKELGLEVPKAEVNALFEAMDPDGSGKLSLAELKTHTQVLPAPQEVSLPNIDIPQPTARTRNACAERDLTGRTLFDRYANDRLVSRCSYLVLNLHSFKKSEIANSLTGTP